MGYQATTHGHVDGTTNEDSVTTSEYTVCMWMWQQKNTHVHVDGTTNEDSVTTSINSVTINKYAYACGCGNKRTHMCM